MIHETKSNNKTPIIEKRHRLYPEIYHGGQIVAITTCIKDRKELFIESEVFEIFKGFLIGELKNFDCSSYVYLFMPDHLHILITGNNDKSDIKECFEMFKQKTGFWLSKHKPNYKWQKDYYDHVLRSSDDLIKQCKYILQNPVRTGLVGYWKHYKFYGSTIYNLQEWD